MGMPTRCAEWLGVSRQRAVTGITFGGGRLVVVALRPDPVRVVGIASTEIVDAAIVDGDVRLPQQVATMLGEMRTALHLPLNTACAVSIEPLSPNIQVGEFGADATAGGPANGHADSVVNVADRAFDRASFVTSAAGFRPERIDVRPAALARIGLFEHGARAAIRTADGWTIAAGGGLLDATKRPQAAVPGLQLGPDLSSIAPLLELQSVAIPRRLRPALDLGRDLEAIGAALSLLELAPLVTVAPTASIAATAEWTVESVPSIRI